MATWFLAGRKCDKCGLEAGPSNGATLEDGDPSFLVCGVRYLCSVCEAKKDDHDPPQNVGFV